MPQPGGSLSTVALGGPYATLAELKEWLGIPDSNTSQDARLTRRLVSASMDINRWCHRQFGRQEEVTVRTGRVTPSGIEVDDFWTATGLTVTPYTGITAGTAWDTTLVVLEPADGIVDGVPGWPYRRICSAYNDHPLYRYSSYTYAGSIRVGACWGWESVPENITTACLMLAAGDNKAKDTPFGVAGFGDYAVRIRNNPQAQEKLDPYVLGGTSANSFMAAS